MRLFATIEDLQGIRPILAHLGLPAEVPSPGPCQLAPPTSSDINA